MSDGNPREGLFYPTLTLMLDSYKEGVELINCSTYRENV